MSTLNSTQARANFYGLLTQVNESHEPITITGKKGNAVLIAEEDWQAINETLYLLSIPSLRESVVEGLNTPLDECSTDLNW
ncbi:type II toxin-antitoxin system Phd/YefM family antitoxin [Thiomicrospira microaerophila]|uniref:type II toxin-antitoxin system Phd/YefM family antitoxin n=1 Tax=Thiomicrospira microaerophila TaxID=406020 RepID=UPI00200BCC16|nr:type II toxin-antitoxin system Phd/YefM family antitoxin [Thiomicrospira microaerophila]UQB42220.1 type II toxin-antitoxin system Phd/YefM family antitoxin [Thiomicrospira microaerophila]